MPISYFSPNLIIFTKDKAYKYKIEIPREYLSTVTAKEISVDIQISCSLDLLLLIFYKSLILEKFNLPIVYN